MRNNFTKYWILTCFLVIGKFSLAQSWPVSVSMQNGQTLKLYAPNPSSLQNGRLQFSAALSFGQSAQDEPVFGMIWATAQTRQVSNTDRLLIQSLMVTNTRFPGTLKKPEVENIKNALEYEISSLSLYVSKKEMEKALALQQKKQAIDQEFSSIAPKLYYRDHSTMLVILDGDPVFQKKEAWNTDVVVNSPNTIIRLANNRFYIIGAGNWYTARNVYGPYQFDSRPPYELKTIEADLARKEHQGNEYESEFSAKSADIPVSEILVSNEPAELIQSDGLASFTPIPNTRLLYVENSPNDIFKNIEDQQYYILLSGRWYASRTLKGNWTYIKADHLPEDFAKIPPGSAKDNVLASVAGTEASRNAVLDAQVPQTARVNRQSATASVDYDGDPEFEHISGTQLYYARNTADPVIRIRNQYYLVDNGIWFQAYSAHGPWTASTFRPMEVDLIPPGYPVYPVKYVYIYDVTPEYIYTGYTPGYLNTFVWGPTIVYGTGYHYKPWHRRYYYPRPCTWGFNMHYAPWSGWSFGFNLYGGWFYSGYYAYSRPYGNCGWWGPARYRPAYCMPSYRHRGYYGYDNHGYNGNGYPRYNFPPSYHRSDIYQQRRDIVSLDDRQPAYNYSTNRRESRPAYPAGDRYNNNADFRRNPQNRPTDRPSTGQPSRPYRSENPARPNGGGQPEYRQPSPNYTERNDVIRRRIESRMENRGTPDAPVRQRPSISDDRPRNDRRERSISDRPAPAPREQGIRRPERRVG